MERKYNQRNDRGKCKGRTEIKPKNKGKRIRNDEKRINGN
jgi:hypothetical protein